MNIKYFYKKNLLWNLFKKVSNLNFAIFILFLVAFFSMIGSLIEQNQSLLYYQVNYPADSNFLSWQLIIFLGLDHVYQAWWFILTLLLLTFSLVSCTFSTQLPAFRYSRRWKFLSNQAVVGNENFSFNSFTNIIYSLLVNNFFIFHKKKSLYSYKGLYGRIAPIFVHFGMIIIVFGTMLGSLSGFVSQEMIPIGETFHIKNIVRSGFFSDFSLDLLARVEKFQITYYSNSSVKQFFSQLSLFFNNNKAISSKLIFVNSPLNFHGMTFYQTDWQINALRLKLGSNFIIQKKFVKANIDNVNSWLCNICISKDSQIFFVLFSLDNSLFLCDENGVVIEKVFVGEEFYINNIRLSVQDIMTSTGLQIKKDPGLCWVYLGFLMVMLSTFISYLSYSQIWVYIKSNKCKFLGSTNRAILFFEEDISAINRIYNRYTFESSLIVSNLFNRILR